MLLTSPVIVVASTLLNDPVEVTEPLIKPSNSKPLVKAPLICEAICSEPLIVLSKSVFVKLAAEPDNDVATILPNDPVEDKLELTLVVAVILPATSTDELTVFTDRIEVPL